MAFVIGLLVLAAVFVWLLRTKSTDVDDCATVLGLSRAPSRAVRGTTAEGLSFLDTVLLEGELVGLPTVVSQRHVRHPPASRRRRQGSDLTVLTLTLPAPSRVQLRLQPRGVLGVVEGLVHDTPETVSVDPDFDAAYVVYARDAEGARARLTAELRADILAFRSRTAGAPPDSIASRLASGLTLGTFQVDGETATYTLFGSQTKANALQLKEAAPLLVRLAAGGLDRPANFA